MQYKSYFALSNIFKLKDSIPLHLRSNLIYKFQCSYCNITYYGKTERHLQVWTGEHVSTSLLTGKSVNNKKKSSGHLCPFEDFTVLNYGSQKLKQLIKESLLVIKD